MLNVRGFGIVQYQLTVCFVSTFVAVIMIHSILHKDRRPGSPSSGQVCAPKVCVTARARQLPHAEPGIDSGGTYFKANLLPHVHNTGPNAHPDPVQAASG